LLVSIEVAKREETPREALDGRPGDGRKIKIRKVRRAGDRTWTLKEMESSRKDELDPKRSRDGRQRDTARQVRNGQARRRGTTQTVPNLLA